MKHYYFPSIVLFLLLSFTTTHAQDTLEVPDVRIRGNYQNRLLKDVIEDIEQAQPVRFFFREEWLTGIKVTAVLENDSLPVALKKILEKSGLSFAIYEGYYVVLLKGTAESGNVARTSGADSAGAAVMTASDPTQPNRSLDKTSFTQKAAGAKTVRLSGNVRQRSTGDGIIGATIYVEELKTGSVTNDNSYYSLNLPPGSYSVIINFVGYQSEKRRVEMRSNKTLNVDLNELAVQLKEVVVSGEAPDRNVSAPQMSVTKLSIREIKRIPTFMGEVDVVRSLLALPGVTTVGEGSTGLNVRGGSIDQNLVLMDEAPVYNSSHLLGLFSVFNPDIVKDVTLYRGGVPAQYGGRVSSVLDIKLKDANAKKLIGRGGIGLVSSRFSLEGPLIKNKLSFIVGGRGSFTDFLLKLSPNKSLQNTRANFFDANAKLEYKINDRNKVYLSGYLGQDVFKLAADSISNLDVNATSLQYKWGTANATLRWNHLFSDKLFVNMTTVYSDYTAKIINPEGPNAFNLTSRVLYKNGKADFTYLPNPKHRLNFGVGAVAYQIEPGTRTVAPGSNILPVDLPSERSLESALYLDDEFKVSEKVTLTGGLRYSLFFNLGPGNVFGYQAGIPREAESVLDTIHYNKGKIIQTYQGLEPRFSVKYSLSNSSSVKLSYNRMRQYIQLISNTTSTIPTDRWKISDQYIRPQIGDQVALGYFRNFFGNAIETSVEVYYKKITDILDYKNGATLLLNPTPEADIIQGLGRAYGVEVLVRKNLGEHLTGWVSYTFSRTQIQMNGNYPEEKINKGSYYPANFDKPHVMNTVANYQINRRLSVSGSFTYSTGRPVSYPTSKYVVGSVAIPNYTSRNLYRIPDYHRLDVSLTLEGNHRRNKKWDGSWTLSVYNLYSRKNAYSIFFKTTNGSSSDSYKLSIFGSAFPSITYNFKF